MPALGQNSELHIQKLPLHTRSWATEAVPWGRFQNLGHLENHWALTEAGRARSAAGRFREYESPNDHHRLPSSGHLVQTGGPSKDFL